MAMVQMELGIGLGQLRRHAEAAAALRRAVGLRLDLARAWPALAEQLEMLGDEHDAAEANAWHTRHGNRDPALVRARLQDAPADILALQMLADLQARTGHDQEAAALLQRALEIEPGFRAARLDLVKALNRRELPYQALAHLDALLGVEPDNPAYRT